MNTVKTDTRKPTRLRVKASQHSTRTGGKIIESSVTPEMIEERARELAVIAGRNPEEITVSDRREASRELHGLDRPASPPNDDPAATGWDWETPVPSTGKQASQYNPPDDSRLPEELVEEGVNDAEHDQMVAARKALK